MRNGSKRRAERAGLGDVDFHCRLLYVSSLLSILPPFLKSQTLVSLRLAPLVAAFRAAADSLEEADVQKSSKSASRVKRAKTTFDLEPHFIDEGPGAGDGSDATPTVKEVRSRAKEERGDFRI